MQIQNDNDFTISLKELLDSNKALNITVIHSLKGQLLLKFQYETLKMAMIMDFDILEKCNELFPSVQLNIFVLEAKLSSSNMNEIEDEYSFVQDFIKIKSCMTEFFKKSIKLK